MLPQQTTQYLRNRSNIILFMKKSGWDLERVTVKDNQLIFLKILVINKIDKYFTLIIWS